jgi:hypothetical protein
VHSCSLISIGIQLAIRQCEISKPQSAPSINRPRGNDGLKGRPSIFPDVHTSTTVWTNARPWCSTVLNLCGGASSNAHLRRRKTHEGHRKSFASCNDFAGTWQVQKPKRIYSPPRENTCTADEGW